MSLTTWHDPRALAAPPAPARPLPHNLEAEGAVLGAILINSAVLGVIGARLAKEHFFEPAHAMIYDVLVKLGADGKPVSPIAAKGFLPEELAPDAPTWPYLVRLMGDAPAPINAPAYADMLIDLHARRAVIAAAQEAVEMAYDPPVELPVGKLIDTALEQIRQVADTLPSEEQESTVTSTLDDLIQAAQENLEGKATNVPTSGLTDLDRTLGGGLRPTRLIVLAGRPGMGKTVILTAIARRAAQKGAGVGLFSLEIDKPEFTARLTASALAGDAAPMDYRDILTGRITSGQIERLTAVRGWLASLSLDVCDRGGLTMQQIETRAVAMGKRFARHGRKLDVVMIDYLQLVRVTDRYKGNVVNEYGEIALAAKNMAKRLNVCVILLSQLSRGVEGRESKRPLLSDLRGSGNIEEHADAVGLLYRPAYYDKHDPKVLAGDEDAIERARGRQNSLELIWEKNRLGPTATDVFFCDVAKSQVDSMERHRMGGN
jgi:replicative DNA helicase